MSTTTHHHNSNSNLHHNHNNHRNNRSNLNGVVRNIFNACPSLRRRPTSKCNPKCKRKRKRNPCPWLKRMHTPKCMGSCICKALVSHSPPAALRRYRPLLPHLLRRWVVVGLVGLRLPKS